MNYSKLIYNIWDANRYSNYTEYKEGFLFQKKYIINDSQCMGLLVLRNELNKLKKTPDKSVELDFLFDFGTFIKEMEKVFLYKNDEDAVLISNTKLEDSNIRQMQFSLKNGYIRTNISRSDQKVSIQLKHNYGKEMSNVYTYVNDTFTTNNTNSDYILLNLIKDIITKFIINFSCYWAWLISTNKILDYIIGNEEIEEFNMDKDYYDEIYTKSEEWKIFCKTHKKFILDI